MISSQYESSEIEMEDGTVKHGQIYNRLPEWIPVVGGALQIRPDFRSRETVYLEADEIVEIRRSDVSMMPSGLVDALNEEELQDLLAYLISGGDAEAPVFSR